MDLKPAKAAKLLGPCPEGFWAIQMSVSAARICRCTFAYPFAFWTKGIGKVELKRNRCVCHIDLSYTSRLCSQMLAKRKCGTEYRCAREEQLS